jgi:hypothetical protein
VQRKKGCLEESESLVKVVGVSHSEKKNAKKNPLLRPVHCWTAFQTQFTAHFIEQYLPSHENYQHERNLTWVENLPGMISNQALGSALSALWMTRLGRMNRDKQLVRSGRAELWDGIERAAKGISGSNGS